MAEFCGFFQVTGHSPHPTPWRLSCPWHELCSDILTNGVNMTSITSDGQVEFRFFRPNVSNVSLVGDFNGWEALAMNASGDGWWTAMMRFDVGEYRFRYLADGQWFSDFASYGVEPTKTGYTSVLRVPDTIRSQHQDTCAKQVA